MKHAVNKTALLLLLTCGLTIAATHTTQRRQKAVTGGPNGIHPYLFKGVSRKNLAGRSGYAPWSILNAPRDDTAKLHIIGVMVEFKVDESDLTTGNGKFGINQRGTVVGTRADREEFEYYASRGGDAYIYDDLEHDYAYFENQLTFVKNYYHRVSNGRFQIDFSLYPESSSNQEYFTVPKEMFRYSPGAKKPRETWDEYYLRRTYGIMEFVRDAIANADTARPTSPFAGLTDSAGVLLDSAGRKTAILLIHAGASYLTDGGLQGYMGQDTPSDMIDAFISPDFFDYFADTLGFVRDEALNRVGIRPPQTDNLLLDEIMMVSETSNQDSLNWGIHGILVNQVARQIGIPDLFSTMSGISGVGAFCIMDFAGYSAGRGFIPPWPSAWVRAFMGWDEIVVADPGKTAYPLKAVSAATPGDTSILLVPINDHEYYLIENRQRNLTGKDLLNYEEDAPYPIDPYDPVNLDRNVVSTLSPGNVIDSVVNYDVGLPASGVLVWHVDERVVKDRLEYNLLNADSLYRAVHLVEADGVNHLGIMFQDIFYQAAFDYGGARDVFPHTMREDGKETATVQSFGPFTRPSTRANDGGHTYLRITINESGSLPSSRELSRIDDETFVYNYVDSVFHISVERDSLVPAIPGWPKTVAPAAFFEPVFCDVYTNGDSLELAAVDSAGRVYVWRAASANAAAAESFGTQIAAVTRTDPRGDTVYTADSLPVVDSVRYLARMSAPVAMPTSVDNKLYIPVRDKRIEVLEAIAPDGSPTWSAVDLPRAPSSYLTNYDQNKWALGLTNGDIVLGNQTSIVATVNADSSRRSAVNALALVGSSSSPLVGAVHANGVVVLIDPSSSNAISTLKLRDGIPPFSVVSADFDITDDAITPQMVVSDSKQGLWMLDTEGELAPAEGWTLEPNDQLSVYHYREDATDESRTLLPANGAAPALADMDSDGVLDIVIGGANGVFVLNRRGVLLPPWPHILDKRYWYQRGSVMSTPALAYDADASPLTVYASPTGENVTFGVSAIDSSKKDKGKVYFRRMDGSRDSITDLTAGFIDSLLVFGDSLILPYMTPGGFIDALDTDAHRPGWHASLPTGRQRLSYWPLTLGGPASGSPMLGDMDANGRVDIIALSNRGWINRWEMSPTLLSDSLIWPQTGYSSARTFAYGGSAAQSGKSAAPGIEHFYTYPNPARNLRATEFKYQLTANARHVRIDVFTYTGYHVYSSEEDRRKPSAKAGWNVHPLKLDTFGPAVYRCRMQADFANGDRDVQFWKMAIIK